MGQGPHDCAARRRRVSLLCAVRVRDAVQGGGLLHNGQPGRTARRECTQASSQDPEALPAGRDLRGIGVTGIGLATGTTQSLPRDAGDFLPAAPAMPFSSVGASVCIADQLHFDGKRDQAHLALGGEHDGAAQNPKRQAGAIGEGQPVFLRLGVECRAGSGMRFIKRDDCGGKAADDGRRQVGGSTALDGFL
jgi:hypothetical protein